MISQLKLIMIIIDDDNDDDDDDGVYITNTKYKCECFF